jgi:sphingomyelin phosphodiesterase
LLIVLAQNDTKDPHPLPPQFSDNALLQTAISQVKWLFATPSIASNNCALCTASLQVAQFLSQAAPEQGPAFAYFLCQQFKISSTCNKSYTATTLGSVFTQVFAYANISGYDGQVRAVALRHRIRCLTGVICILSALVDMRELCPELV